MRQKAPAILTIVTLAAYFFSLSWRGLWCSFTPDDLMNCYRAFIQPLSHWLRGNLLFFEPPTRSLGQLFYALVFHFDGLNPLPYRIVCFAFLAVNLYLTYLVSWRLTGSRRVGCLAALLLAFHGNFSALYYNTGTCYDVLCFFFYLAAFLYYLRIRQADAYPNLWQAVAMTCVYILALNSKEMAVTFPVMIAVFEWLYHGRKGWLLRNTVIYATGTVTAIFIAGSLHGPDSLANVPAYHLSISVASYMLTTRAYLNDLIYSVHGFDNVRTVALFAILAAIAWLLRDRALKFCWWFILIGALPIAFIEPRGLYAYYIPMVGLATFLAVLLAKAVNRVESPLVCAALFAVCAAGLAAIHIENGALHVDHILGEQRHIQSLISGMKLLCPTLPKGSRVLIIKDPFDNGMWNSVFLLTLLYRDPSLQIDRLAMLKTPPATYAGYHDVLTFENGQLSRVTATQP